MLKSIQSHTTYVHVGISHINDYHVYEQNYMITIHVVNFFYTITHNVCLMFFSLFFSICILYVYVYFLSPCGAILSLIAYHLPSSRCWSSILEPNCQWHNQYMIVTLISQCANIQQLRSPSKQLQWQPIMISFTMDMLGCTPNKGKPITGHTGHLRVHLPNRRPGKLDKLSHNAHKPDSLSQEARQEA